MTTHSSILAWKIPWTEEAGKLQFMGPQRVRHNWAIKHTHIHSNMGKTVGQNMVKMVPNISIAKISIEYINLTVKEKGTLRLQNNKISK